MRRFAAAQRRRCSRRLLRPEPRQPASQAVRVVTQHVAQAATRPRAAACRLADGASGSACSHARISDEFERKVMLNDTDTSSPFFTQCGNVTGTCTPWPGSSSNAVAFAWTRP